MIGRLRGRDSDGYSGGERGRDNTKIKCQGNVMQEVIYRLFISMSFDLY